MNNGTTWIMDNQFFSINNLSVNPNIDFLNNLFNQGAADDPDNFSGSPYDSTNISCKYLDPLEYANQNRNSKNVSILTLNIQSLSAKFKEFSELIQILASAKCSPDIICLQEIWQINRDAFFSLPGYSNIVYKTRSNNVQGGGVGIYVGSHLSYSVSPVHSVFC